MYLPSILVLRPRQVCNGFNDYGCNDGSSWENWGRYVVLGGVILVALGLFLIMACITARKRRARGAQPYYGTGWMGGHGNVNYYGPNGGNPQPYYGSQQYGQQPYGQAAAPPYEAQGGANQGYYYGDNNYGNRAQDGGIELQPPVSAYQPQAGGDSVYAPPAGPPPGKKGDIVR